MKETEDKIPVSNDDWVTVLSIKVIKRAFKIFAPIIALIISLLSLFGYKSIHDTFKALESAKSEMNKLKDEMQDNSVKYEKLVDSMEYDIKTIKVTRKENLENNKKYLEMLFATYSTNVSNLIEKGINVNTVKRDLDSSFKEFNKKNKIISEDLDNNKEIIQKKLAEISSYKDSLHEENEEFKKEFKSEIIGLSERTPVQISEIAGITIKSDIQKEKDESIRNFEVSDLETKEVLIKARMVYKGDTLFVTNSNGLKFSIKILEVISMNVPGLNGYAILKITQIKE